MIAEIRVTPVRSALPFGRLVGTLVPLLAESPLGYEVHAMGTTVEGSLDEILELVRRAHAELQKHADRVLLELSLDDREAMPGELARATEHLRDATSLPLSRACPESAAGAGGIAERVRMHLEELRVPFERIHHARDFTAQETAHHTHTPGHAFAKAVIVRSSGGYAMAVVPAHHELDFERLGEALGRRHVELASEEDVARICPDCEVGAVPPFGNLYGLPVHASAELAEAGEITCVAGSHAEAIRLAWDDYESVVHPALARFSAPRVEGLPRGAPSRG